MLDVLFCVWENVISPASISIAISPDLNNSVVVRKPNLPFMGETMSEFLIVPPPHFGGQGCIYLTYCVRLAKGS